MTVHNPSDDAATGPKQPASGKKNLKTVLIVIAVIVAICCIGSGIVAATADDSDDRSRPAPTATASSKAEPEKSEAAETDPKYSTCTEVKAKGLGPYQRGVDPEYQWYEDRDNDGKVCD